MTFRAIGAGGAITLRDALVGYRRGGVSRRVRNLSAADVVQRLLSNNRHALIEYEQLLRDARTLGQLPTVQPVLEAELERERFIQRLFAAPGWRAKFRLAWSAGAVAPRARCRLFAYAATPWVFAPLFWLKRRVVSRAPATA
jgi:hypothetical protein